MISLMFCSITSLNSLCLNSLGDCRSLYFSRRCFEFMEGRMSICMSVRRIKSFRIPGAFGSNGFDLGAELEFKEKEGVEKSFEFEKLENGESRGNGSDIDVNFGLGKEKEKVKDESLKGLLEDERKNMKVKRGFRDEDLVGVEDVKIKGFGGEKAQLLKGRQFIKRSNVIAKQVIAIQTALSLGFVSQLWVETSIWTVLLVEVRPNLLSAESDKFLVKDIKQVGDVVLVQDESVFINELGMVGLETLVGYNVVTPQRRNIGKVRGYAFDVDSGKVESLELDSFGMSIIPSSLVSTYALLVEDVLEVVPDTIIVHEAAASRIQRLTKGLWTNLKMDRSVVDLKYSGSEEETFARNKDRKVRKKFKRKEYRPRVTDGIDDLEPPLDYL